MISDNPTCVPFGNEDVTGVACEDRIVACWSTTTEGEVGVQGVVDPLGVEIAGAEVDGRARFENGACRVFPRDTEN